MTATKIGIAGSHSTGKTTFTDAVAGRLEDCGLRVGRVADLASTARVLGFPILREHTFESTLWIMTAGISRELESALHADVLLVDRPVPDALGYYIAALESRGLVFDAHAREHRYLIDLARHHADTYKLIFLTSIDPSIPIDSSKPRDMDSGFRTLAAKGVSSAFGLIGKEPDILMSSGVAAAVAKVMALVP